MSEAQTSTLDVRLRVLGTVFRRGESFDVEVAIRNEGSTACSVRDPARRDDPELRYRIVGGERPIELSGAPDSSDPPIVIEPGDTLWAYVPIARWTDLPPGQYAVSASLTLEGSPPVKSNEVSFSIFEPERAHVVVPRLDPGRPKTSESLTVAISGAEAGQIVDVPLVPDLEHEGHYDILAGQVRVVPPRPARRLLSVLTTPDDPWRWAVWTDEVGLVARAGDATVMGVTEVPLPGPSHVLAPVLQQPDGSALVYVVAGEQPTLSVYRISPPVTEIEPAKGPDDWDDEVLVAGPAQPRALASLAFVPSRSAVIRDGEGARLVVTSDSDAGIAVMHLSVGDGLGPSASVLLEGARPLPDVDPVLRISADGHSEVHVLFWRPRRIAVEGQRGSRDDPHWIDLFVGTTHFSEDQVVRHAERPVGTVAQPVRSAAAAASADGQPAQLAFAVLDHRGSLCVADARTGLVPVSVEGTPSVPLALATSPVHTYVCFETPRGPLPIVVA